MSNSTWVIYSDGAAMAEAVAERVAEIILEAQQFRGRAVLAFPGGQSPIPAFLCLRGKSIAWPQVTILPTDDRLVAPDDPLSNTALLAHHFKEWGAKIVPLVTDINDDHKTVGLRANESLKALPWPLDLVWLGMGKDGHTASLFPGPDLEDALNLSSDQLAIGVLPDPLPTNAPVARVTLTRSAITSSRYLILTLSGQEKLGVLKQTPYTDNPSSLPISRVLARAGGHVEIHWSPA